MPDSWRAPWVIVSGSFHQNGGMDKANWVLARYLLERGTPVHLVAHEVDEALRRFRTAVVHSVARPLGSYFLGGPLLDVKARAVYQRLRQQMPTTRLVANGGNCVSVDVNWSHYVVGAWKPDLSAASSAQRMRWTVERAWEQNRERMAYRAARLIIANSEMTARDVERCAAPVTAQIKTLYLGCESGWNPITMPERLEARHYFGIAPNRKVAAFVGCFGMDRRKGFDVLLESWHSLSRAPDWDVDLLVAGTGPGLRAARQRVAQLQLEKRIRMLGFSREIPRVLAASDVLVSGSRYEPYGLNIQEALTRGLPTVISERCGIAERYPVGLKPLLFQDPESPEQMSAALRHWRERPEYWQQQCADFGMKLRQQDWRSMANEMVEFIESTQPASRYDAFAA